MELKQIESKKRVVMWRQWVLAIVCLVLACFHALSYAYALGMVFSSLAAFDKMDKSKRPFLPFKEILGLAVCFLSVALSYLESSKHLILILDSKTVKLNMKPVFSLDAVADFHVYERQFLGTDLHREVAWDFTKLTFKLCACVYAVAFVLIVYFNIVDALGLFSVMLMMIFSALLAFFFVRSFLVNLNIALRLGEVEQNEENETLVV